MRKSIKNPFFVIVYLTVLGMLQLSCEEVAPEEIAGKSVFELIDAEKPGYYYYQNERQPLLPIGNQVLIGLKSSKEQKEKVTFLNELDDSSSFFDVEKSYPGDIETVPDKYIFAHLRDGWQSADRSGVEKKLELNPEVTFVSPLYRTSQSSVTVALTLQLFVMTNDDDFPERYQELLGGYGVIDVQKLDPQLGVYLLTLKEKNQYNALDVANELHESGKFISASPSFLSRISFQVNHSE